MARARVRLVCRSCDVRNTSTRMPAASFGTLRIRRIASGATPFGRTRPCGISVRAIGRGPASLNHGVCTLACGGTPDFGADAFIGEDLEQDRVQAATVEDVDFLDAELHGVESAAHL